MWSLNFHDFNNFRLYLKDLDLFDDALIKYSGNVYTIREFLRFVSSDIFFVKSMKMAFSPSR